MVNLFICLTNKIKDENQDRKVALIRQNFSDSIPRGALSRSAMYSGEIYTASR